MLDSLLQDRYKLISVLGTGGFGQTYLAVDLIDVEQSHCVVKQFKPAKDDANFLEIARRLFDTEVKTLERLGKHPQIPTFLEFFEEADQFYLVQEFIDGYPLNDEFSPFHRLSEAEAIALLHDVLGVLDFVHSQQVIHRDIKPSNLIRRRSDDKVVLIDFGAVKEIRTQLLSETEQKFTVGIGTQGYTPSEQLAGKPRYCSDLYALGVTVIQGITGIQPVQLATDPETGELIWQAQAPIGLGLQRILEKMVRYHFNQRYQSAQEVLAAIDRLSEVSLESTILPSSLIMPPSLLHHPIGDETIVDSPLPGSRSRLDARRGIQIIGIAAIAITGLLAGVRQVGWLQGPELRVYDQLVRLRPPQSLDPRLLIIEITEADLQTLQRGTPADRDVAQVIQNLQQHQPRVIGLDLHRDLPQEPGHAELRQQLQADNVVTIMKLGNDSKTFDIPPPAGVPADRLGFNDFAIDPDGVVRRNLLYATIGQQNFMSFALRLATKYLQPQIVPRQSDQGSGIMQLDKTIFWPIETTSGGYQQIDAAGYQIMLDYRSPQSPAPQLSFVQVLQGQFNPTMVTDKIVVIGTTAASGKDLFYTPFSSGNRGEYLMPGVVIHAQMVSQVLSSVLDQQPLLRVFPDGIELLWIGSWAIMGGSLAWFARHPFLLSLGGIIVLGLLGSSVWFIFMNHGWLPSLTPTIALLLTGATVMSWRSYQHE